jgi:hypothetical protein
VPGQARHTAQRHHRPGRARRAPDPGRSLDLGRFDAEGEAGLRDRSSRPHSSPRRTAAEVEDQIVGLRPEHRRGQDWIGPEVGVAPRMVCRVLRRHQVPYLRECDSMTGEVIRSSKATAVRYERDRPGELVHMDVKKIGKIPDGGGWRAHGRQMGSTGAQKRARIGYDYVHSLVDDHSRLAYSENPARRKGRHLARSCAAPRPTSPPRASPASSA